MFSVMYNVSMKILISLTIFFSVIMTGHAFALGEVFRVDITGTKYCEDFDREMFGPRNISLWIQILRDKEMIVSFTPTFEPGTTFPLNGSTYFTEESSAVFGGGVSFRNDSHFIIRGKIYFDKWDAVKFMKGIFMDKDILFPGCFSYGTFWTMERLQ